VKHFDEFVSVQGLYLPASLAAGLTTPMLTIDSTGEVTAVEAPTAGGGGSGDTAITAEVKLYAGTSLPTGYLWANGQAVSRSTYADLFSAIGTTYGAGNGSTTFNVPDLRGRVPVGPDALGGASDAGRLSANQTLGASGGEEKHQLTISEMPSHSHSYTRPQNFDENGGTLSSALARIQQNTTTGSAGGDQAHNTMQPFLVLNYVIKT
jgi:microcystin-dependent protein